MRSASQRGPHLCSNPSSDGFSGTDMGGVYEVTLLAPVVESTEPELAEASSSGGSPRTPRSLGRRPDEPRLSRLELGFLGSDEGGVHLLHHDGAVDDAL